MGPTQIHLVSIAVVYVAALAFVSGDDIILQKRSERNRMDLDRFLQNHILEKRPFCNAFSGCGKKRTGESMATLVELNSEPAVEDLNKRIMSEAKLWEAIQEARAEMARRQQRQSVVSQNLPLAFMSSYRRKRSPDVGRISNDYEMREDVNHR